MPCDSYVYVSDLSARLEICERTTEQADDTIDLLKIKSLRTHPFHAGSHAMYILWILFYLSRFSLK
jgi:hypothetical protein